MTSIACLTARLRQGLGGAVVAAGLLFAASATEASPVWVRDGNGGTAFNGTIGGVSAPGSVNLTINVNGSNVGVSAGAFALQYGFTASGPFTDFFTYCLQPNETLGIGATPLPGDLVSPVANGASPYAANAVALTQLWNTWFEDSLDDATKSAAFQIAVWEVAMDGTGGGLGSGNFKFTATGDDVRNQANAYLNSAGWAAASEGYGVIVRVGQDLMLQVPVPAPAALGVFGLGLIGLTIAARRRRQQG